MNMQKISFLDHDSLDRDDLDLSCLDIPDTTLQVHASTSTEQRLAHIHDANIIITNKVVIDEAIIEQSPSLQLICVAATGYNNVAIRAAQAAGITVCNVTRYATPSVVEHVFMLILNLHRRLDAYRKAIATGDWTRSEQFCLLDPPFAELSSKTLGIIGYGELGSAVARMGECFGMQVMIAERPGSTRVRPERVSPETLYAEADIISLHCPLADNTRNLIDSEALAQMKPTALLVNAARGGIVDEQALADALRQGVIAGAGVDVLTEEPPVNGNVLLDESIPNLIITPHIAWASQASRQRLIEAVAGNISAWLAGAPRNVIV
jgi:glycerate dehydrogenase